MEGRCVRLVLSGEVQDSPFEGALARELRRRPAVLRRIGPALEVRAAMLSRETYAVALRNLKAAVTRAARASRAPVKVVAASAEEGAPEAPSVELLPPASGGSGAHLAVPSPRADLAPCAECAREILQQGRRHGYLRAECSACGPRYSHAVGFPLERGRYGLGSMPPCEACRRERMDSSSRRFASERISCADCGPTPTLLPPSGPPWVKAAVRRAADRLRAGDVVAVQTPYGFVALAVPAHIAALRVEIGNEFAPLRLIVPSPGAARSVAETGPAETRALFSPRAPDLLVSAKQGKETLASELCVFGSSLRIAAPDSAALLLLTRELGPLVAAAASRGGSLLPATAGAGKTLPTADWLTDGAAQGDPVAAAQAYFAGRSFVLLAHGRGSLPATAHAGGPSTALAFGGGRELFGAAAFGGESYLTGSAGTSARGDSAPKLRRLLSRAAALSPAVSAEALDFVVAAPEEGSPGRLAAEETATEADCPLRIISSTAARGAAAQLALPRPARAALVLGADEPAADTDGWLKSHRTGGDLIDAPARRVLGGIAPYEVVESPGGREDALAPLASLFERVGLPVEGASADNSPILEVLRQRAETSTSFVLLVDAVAAALNLVPRRAPAGSGVAEVAAYTKQPAFARRFRMSAPLVRARGARHADASALLKQLADQWHAAHGREGRGLAWERRAALAASFTAALVDGVSRSARASLGRGARVGLSGGAFAARPLFLLVSSSLKDAGLVPAVSPDLPLLDGAVPIGQILLAHRWPAPPSPDG